MEHARQRAAGPRRAEASFAAAPGPGKGRGEAAGTAAAARAAARAIHCVNCGECNGVCPVYDSSAIALPQTLTHHGELAYAGAAPGPAVAALLDLCMRCGNCEEVCQAGIPHLEVYAGMAAAADCRGALRLRAPRAGAGLGARRRRATATSSSTCARACTCGARPAALTGAVRFRVLRAENDAGPAATCLHCAACVPACPTNANLEFRDADARLVSTDELSCIGCGACVEVCPANKLNGGQTLRVVEAPTAAALDAIAEFERTGA